MKLQNQIFLNVLFGISSISKICFHVSVCSIFLCQQTDMKYKNNDVKPMFNMEKIYFSTPTICWKFSRAFGTHPDPFIVFWGATFILWVSNELTPLATSNYSANCSLLSAVCTNCITTQPKAQGLCHLTPQHQHPLLNTTVKCHQA